MSLYDKSSLLQVPSLYKDGTLVSTIPEDRSGDFTVSRGSNLAATRIGPDGYIKKGYENLLLHSNQFDTTWAFTNGTLTGGQSGYDETNDAWLFTKSASFGQVRQSISASNVLTCSVYIKLYDETEADSIYFRADSSSGTASAYFNLSTQSVNVTSNIIDSNIESVGDGWFRISMTFDRAITIIRIYPSLGNDTNNTTGSIYIQDSQLNQGLVAYPYLETTTAPAQGGLLENSPRLDWSNGVPSVLVEEQRTNLVPQTEYITIFSNVTPTYNTTDTLSPEGLYNALKAEAIGSNPRVRTQYTASDGVYTLSLFVKQGSSSYLKMVAYDRTNNHEATFDLTDGTFSGETTGVTAHSEDYGNGWYRCAITYTSAVSDTGLNYAQSYVNNGSTGNIYVYGYQAEQASTSTSYIPTYGTTQTRSNEVISDNFNIPTTATIYNSFYSDVAETVFVFDQVFNVVEGLNKVAIAFSPTAVKISVGGSIVANATGTYDTTSLTNIQLGSNNGTDYSNAPISGFYVFPEFLTNEELNSLTD